jgi:hypothetical protein
MKTIILSLLVLTLTSGFAQQVVTWKGGTPGRETAWNEPSNWSNQQVPDEDTHVLIERLHTGHYAQPVIDDWVEVASIRIHAGASLTVTESGEIVIDGSWQYSPGIVNLGGNLVNDGLIQLVDIAEESTERMIREDWASGLLLLNGQPLESAGLARK